MKRIYIKPLSTIEITDIEMKLMQTHSLDWVDTNNMQFDNEEVPQEPTIDKKGLWDDED